MEWSYQWNKERWEEFENNRWELIKELGDKYYELYENYYGPNKSLLLKGEAIISKHIITEAQTKNNFVERG